MKKYCFCILLICVATRLWGISDSSSQLRERLYVQTDKHLYLAGEQVLIKVVTTDAELKPIDFSKVAYIELVDSHASRIQIMISVSNATGTGQMQLPVDLPSGYYRLKAYTQYMRNEGSDAFFEKQIAVLNTFQSGYHLTEIETEIVPISTRSVENGNPRLQPDKTTYTKREHGKLTINGLPENIHTLTVSVVGKEIVPVAWAGRLFLENRTKRAAEFTDEFIPEYEGHIITGKIINNETERQQGDLIVSPAISFPGDEIRFYSGQKTEDGDLRFFTSGVLGTTEIATIAYNTDERFRVDIASPFVLTHTPEQLSPLLIDSACYRTLLERSVALQLSHYFTDSDDAENPKISQSNFRAEPTRKFPLDDYTRFTTMREVFIEFITGARFRRNAGKWEISILVSTSNYMSFGIMPLVLLDGVPVVDHDAIYNYDPLLVEHINLYYGPFIMGGYRFDGIVELLTYRGLHQNLTLNRASQVLKYEMPQLPYRFNAPDYSIENNRISRVPDGRHTLLWQPDVRTEGKTSVSVPFNTSDLTGEFQAIVEGITKDGKIFFAETVFKVEN